MKYACVIIAFISFISSISRCMADPWMDGTWKYPVFYTSRIYRLNAYTLCYNLNNQNTIATLPNNNFNPQPRIMPRVIQIPIKVR